MEAAAGTGEPDAKAVWHLACVLRRSSMCSTHSGRNGKMAAAINK
jgi:hypothetical protein